MTWHDLPFMIGSVALVFIASYLGWISFHLKLIYLRGIEINETKKMPGMTE